VEVRAVDLAGTTIETARTNNVGTFRFRDLPRDCRLEANLPGGPKLSLEVRDGDQSWLWVNGATTLVSRLMQRRSELSQAEATRRIKAYLGIPESVNLASGLGDTWRSPFSWSEFVKQAGKTPLDVFLDQQVEAALAGQTASFRKNDPFPAIHALLGRTALTVPAPALGSKSTMVSVNAFFDGFGANVFAGVTGNLVTGIVKGGVGAIMEASGCNYGTSAQLNEIQTSLTTIEGQETQILNELGIMQDTITIDFNNEAIQSVLQQLGPVTQRVRLYSQNYQVALTGVQAALTAPSTAIAAPPAAATLFVNNTLRIYYNANNGSLLQDISTLRSALLGLNNQNCLPLLYNTAAAAQYGSNNPSAAYLYVDVRSNTINENLCNQLDYYRAVQVLAFNLLAEYSHVDANTFPTSPGAVPTNVLPANLSHVLPANLSQAVSTMRQMTADLVAEGQLAPPPTFASDDVFTWQNTMFYTNIQYLGSSPQDLNEAQGSCSNFSLGPWGVDCWQLPNLNQITALHNLATAAGNGNVITGLQKMGFVVPSNASQSNFTFAINNGTGYYYNMIDNTTNDGTPSGDAFFIPVRLCPGYAGNYPYTVEDVGTAQAITYPQSLEYAGTSNGALVNMVYTQYNPLNKVTTRTIGPSSDVPWSSSAPTSFELSNIVGQQGSVVYHTSSPGSGSVTASVFTSATTQPSGFLAPSSPLTLVEPFATLLASLTAAPATAPTLVSIFITPQNRLYTTTNEVVNGTSQYSDPYFATGSYSDGTFQDLTNQVEWTVAPTGPAGSPIFSPLQLYSSKCRVQLVHLI